jgi:hypothetical protein
MAFDTNALQICGLLNCRVRCFQQLDRVAQLGGALVEFAGDRDFHLALYDLELRERAFRTDFLELLFEKVSSELFVASSGWGLARTPHESADYSTAVSFLPRVDLPLRPP